MLDQRGFELRGADVQLLAIALPQRLREDFDRCRSAVWAMPEISCHRAAVVRAVCSAGSAIRPTSRGPGVLGGPTLFVRLIARRTPSLFLSLSEATPVGLIKLAGDDFQGAILLDAFQGRLAIGLPGRQRGSRHLDGHRTGEVVGVQISVRLTHLKPT